MANSSAPNKGRIRVVCMASFSSAIPVLDALMANKRLELVLLVTKPDKKQGRGQMLTPSKLKCHALDKGIRVYQPEIINIEENLSYIDSFDPDVIFLIGYGKIIGHDLLNLPKYKCINAHPSLLPKYRGASPVQATILHGDKETGITYIVMDAGMDTGDIIYQEKIKIKKEETADMLKDRLIKIVVKTIAKVILNYIDDKLIPYPQDRTKATYCHMINKEDGKIDWTENTEKIANMIRAYTSWPGTFTDLGDWRLKIIKAEQSNKSTEYRSGTFFLDKSGDPAISCGDGCLILKEVQIEGKKAISGKEFVNGYSRMALTRCR